MSVELLRRHRLSVDDFHRMAEAGILGPEDRVELIEGELIDIAPIGTRHAACVRRLIGVFGTLPRTLAILDVQNPVRLNEETEPQPDAMLLRPRADFYADRIPGPEDVLLLIEVSDTTGRYDRETKLPLYARHGVPEVWIADLGGEAVQVCRDPSGDGYVDTRFYRRGEAISPGAIPGLTVAVADVLP